MFVVDNRLCYNWGWYEWVSVILVIDEMDSQLMNFDRWVQSGSGYYWIKFRIISVIQVNRDSNKHLETD